MKIKNLIVVTPLPFIFMACDSGWTDAQEEEYKKNCHKLDSVTEKQCDCAFDKFSIEYSYSEYSPLNEELVNQELSDREIDEAIRINKEIRKCFE